MPPVCGAPMLVAAGCSIKQLQADLASFTSDADRFDLEATLDRYPDQQTLEIRRLLAQQAVS